MLLMNPEVVRFGTYVWEDVETLAVDRQADRSIVEHDDVGPHAVFADVPEQTVRIRIVRRLSRDDIEAPVPGEKEDLVFYTSPAGTDTGRKRMTTTAVVLGVKHDLSPAAARQVVTLVAVSASGDAEPVTVEEV